MIGRPKIPSSRSAFSSPEKKPRPASAIQSSSAPNISSLGGGRWHEISLRCHQVENGIAQLKKDHKELASMIDQSYYRDEHISRNINAIKEMLENSLISINNIAEHESGQIWKKLQTSMEETLTTYQKYLHMCPGRADFLECQKCFERLKKLLLLIDGEDESKLTCCVCLDAQVNCAAACGHLLCSTCTQSVEKCPVCRKKIEAHEIRPLYFC